MNSSFQKIIRSTRSYCTKSVKFKVTIHIKFKKALIPTKFVLVHFSVEEDLFHRTVDCGSMGEERNSFAIALILVSLSNQKF